MLQCRLHVAIHEIICIIHVHVCTLYLVVGGAEVAGLVSWGVAPLISILARSPPPPPPDITFCCTLVLPPPIVCSAVALGAGDEKSMPSRSNSKSTWGSLGFFTAAATWRGCFSWLLLEAGAVVVSKLLVVVLGLLRCCLDLGGREGPLRPPNSWLASWCFLASAGDWGRMEAWTVESYGEGGREGGRERENASVYAIAKIRTAIKYVHSDNSENASLWTKYYNYESCYVKKYCFFKVKSMVQVLWKYMYNTTLPYSSRCRESVLFHFWWLRSWLNSIHQLLYHSRCGCGWSLHSRVLPVATFTPHTLHSMAYTWDTERERAIEIIRQIFMQITTHTNS